jgi:hypothetical protein
MRLGSAHDQAYRKNRQLPLALSGGWECRCEFESGEVLMDLVGIEPATSLFRTIVSFS